MPKGKATQTTVRSSDIMAILERQGFRCALSGRQLTPESATIDHIVPLARDGEHCLANLWVVQAAINKAKNTMTCDEFLAMCRDVVRFADHGQETEVA
jgi:5-methylcytosine-specific restriction endonuclease McrA